MEKRADGLDTILQVHGSNLGYPALERTAKAPNGWRRLIFGFQVVVVDHSRDDRGSARPVIGNLRERGNLNPLNDAHLPPAPRHEQEPRIDRDEVDGFGRRAHAYVLPIRRCVAPNTSGTGA